MSNYKDKRSVVGKPANQPEVERVMKLAADAAEPGPAAVPEAPRRIASGARTFSQFFEGEKHRREITRGEWLNLMSMLEYQRYESLWWRRIWRWLRHMPPVASFIPAMRDAHERTLADAQAKLKAAHEALQARVLEAKEKLSQAAEEKPHA